jgi:formamidopyrimidine-DNA glycosylase
MPELPEVETIRRQLAPLVEGRRLRTLEILDPRWTAPLAPEAVADAVGGRRIERLSRRGKYLVFELADEVFLLVHLRMTGTLLYDPPPGAPYVRVVFALGDGHELRFCDPRRFGTGELALGSEARDAFFAARLGIEPLGGELTGERLRALAHGRRAPVKAFLLDQRRVAGVGNIYADEALFRARIHPLRPAGALTRVQYEALAEAVRDALTAGLAAGGATIDDFRHADGVTGAFQHEFQIHLRAGAPCLVCGGDVVKLVVGGRGTYVCPRCQRPPRSSAAAKPRPRPAARAAARSGRPGRAP